MRKLVDAKILEEIIPPHICIKPEPPHKVILKTQLSLRVYCLINLSEYPLDTQNCTLEFTHREFTTVTKN